MSYEVNLPTGHVISDDRARLDIELILATLATTYWAHDRPRAITERSIAHCLCFGVYGQDGAQVGFARLLTDYASRAHLADVFVLPSGRGLGLGKALVAAILEHPELATVHNWTLTTGDAHGLYARFGFHLGEADGKWMTMERSLPAT
jgi:GNAT superfamily N-acetyltransferase